MVRRWTHHAGGIPTTAARDPPDTSDLTRMGQHRPAEADSGGQPGESTHLGAWRPLGACWASPDIRSQFLCKEPWSSCWPLGWLAFGGESAMTSDVVLRWVRALTLASVLFTSGLAGHAAGGGLIPAASVLVSLFVLTVVAVAPFARAPVRPAGAVALLVGGQGLLHAALQLLSGTAVTAPTVMCGADMGAMAASSSTASCHLMTHSGAASRWSCDAVDEWRASPHVAWAPSCRGRGWGVVGGWGAGSLDAVGDRCPAGG